MDRTTLSDDDAHVALNTPSMAPPARGPQFTKGATADLRDAMARFSNAADHPPRRLAVVAAVDAIDLLNVTNTAAEVMSERLGVEGGSANVDVIAAGWEVPSYTLATVLGFAERREQIRADAEIIARVIGRNEPSNPAADAATGRLLALFDDHADPVAAVSLLYQNHDASAGLVPRRVMAAFALSESDSAGQTVRVAEEQITIGTHTIESGEAVQIELAGIPYGAGPHRCPGEDLANAIVDGIVAALSRARYRFRASLVEVDAAGSPIRFEMERPSRQ